MYLNSNNMQKSSKARRFGMTMEDRELRGQLEPATRNYRRTKTSVRKRKPTRILYTVGDDSENDGGELGRFRFRPFKALSRAVHITKTSFQPKKIFGAIGSVFATTATLGLGPIIAPKVFSASSATMKTLGMAVSAIAVVAGAVVLGPAIAASLGPMMSSAAGLLGKAVTGMSTFMKAFNFLSPAKREQMASELTAQQIADVETGKASLTEQGLSYDNQPPGSLRVQGEMVPAGYGNDPASLQPQTQLPSGINPTYLMIGGGVALAAVMMMQRKG